MLALGVPPETSHHASLFFSLSLFLFYPLSDLFLPPCLCLSLSLTFMLFVSSFSVPGSPSFFLVSHSADTFSHSLLCLTLSPPPCQGQHLSVLISLQSVIQTARCLALKVCSASASSNFLHQHPFCQVPVALCCHFLARKLCLETREAVEKWGGGFFLFSLFSFIHPEVYTPTFSFLPLCCLYLQFSTHLIPFFFFFILAELTSLAPSFTLPV